MKKRIKEQLIGKTIVEVSILVVISLIFWKLFLTYDYIPTVELAPKALSIFSVLLLIGSVGVGMFSYKKRDKFYLRYVIYGIIYGASGFYIVFSQNIYFLKVVWAVTALFIAISIFYTAYRVKQF